MRTRGFFWIVVIALLFYAGSLYFLYCNKTKDVSAPELRGRPRTEEETLVKEAILNRFGKNDPGLVVFEVWGPHMGNKELRNILDEAKVQDLADFFEERDRIDLDTLSNSQSIVRVCYLTPAPDDPLCHDDLYAVAGKKVMRLGEGSDFWIDNLRFVLSRKYPHIEPPAKDRIAQARKRNELRRRKLSDEREARLRTEEEKKEAERLEQERDRERQACEPAITRGLHWLALHQAAEGHWSLDQFSEHARRELSDLEYIDDQSTGRGMKNDTAGAAFGLLPFLAEGITHKPSGDPRADRYVRTVKNGLNYLLQKQSNKDGSFPGGMYSHGLATRTICQAYELTADPLLKKPAQAALNYIVAAQDPESGGWRYQPRQGGDTSVFGWQMAALQAGIRARLNVPQSTLDGATRWLDSVETTDGGGYGYTGPSDAPAMSAVGLLCRRYLGTAQGNRNLQNGVKKLLNSPPTGKNMYYEYYATQIMHDMGGEFWEKWNGNEKQQGMRDLLINLQDRNGSWDSKDDPHGSAGGRIMQTSLSLLTLELCSQLKSNR
jgi:hypothetical protein